MPGFRLLLAALTAALLIALPTAAHAAATASNVDGVLTVESTTPGWVNDLTVDRARAASATTSSRLAAATT